MRFGIALVILGLVLGGVGLQETVGGSKPGGPVHTNTISDDGARISELTSVYRPSEDNGGVRDNTVAIGGIVVAAVGIFVLVRHEMRERDKSRAAVLASLRRQV